MRSTRSMLNSIAGHDIIDQYSDALETDSSREPRKTRNWFPLEMITFQGPKCVVGRQSSMLREQKFNYQQLTPMFTTLELDKWTNQTNTHPRSVSFSLLWRRYLPSLCLLKCHHSKAFLDHSFPSLNSLLPCPVSFFLRGLITTGPIICLLAN